MACSSALLEKNGSCSWGRERPFLLLRYEFKVKNPAYKHVCFMSQLQEVIKINNHRYLALWFAAYSVRYEEDRGSWVSKGLSSRPTNIYTSKNIPPSRAYQGLPWARFLPAVCKLERVVKAKWVQPDEMLTPFFWLTFWLRIQWRTSSKNIAQGDHWCPFWRLYAF